MDPSAPQNPNKPRRWPRRLLSHFTLTLSVLLALSFVTLAVVGPTTEKVEAIAPLVIIGAIAVGAVIGWVANELSNNRDNAAISTYNIDDYLLSMGLALKDKTNVINGIVGDYENNIDLMQYFFIRQAEWAARELYLEQEELSQEHVYDQYYVLTESTVAESLYSFYEYSCEQYEALFSPYSSIGNTFSGTFSTGKYGIMLDGTTDYCFYTSPTRPYSGVDMINGLLTNKYYYFNSTPAVVGYVTGDPTVFSFTDTAGVKVYNHTIDAGTQDITSDLPPGIYKIQYTVTPSTSCLFGDAVPVYTSTCYPTFAFKSEATENIDWNWSIGVTVNTRVNWIQRVSLNSYNLGTNTNLYNLRAGFSETITMDTTNGFGNTSRTIDIKTLLNNLDALNVKMAEITTNVNNFAQSYYNAIVASGDPGADFGLPLMLFPDSSQMDGMDWEQIYAIYVAYLQQAYSYYQDHADDLDPSKVNISAESLKLKIRGSIINETGITLYDNTTIYTPFVTTDSVTIELGLNDWNCAAYAVKWGNADSIANFTTSAASIISLNPGFKLYVQEIVYDNESVDSIDLEVTNVQLTVIDGSTPPGPPGTINDAEWLLAHWYYFAIIAGVICLLAAISFRNMAIIATGVILLAAGAIGWYLAGDTSLLSWLSMEPPNLRAWLQGLR